MQKKTQFGSDRIKNYSVYKNIYKKDKLNFGSGSRDTVFGSACS